MSRLLSTFIGTIVRPFGAIQKLKEEGMETPITFYLLYSAVLFALYGVIVGIITAIMPSLEFNFFEVVRGVIGLWVLLFLTSFVYWGVTVGFFKGSLNEYKSVYRLLAIATTFFPIIGILISIPGAIGFFIVLGCALLITAYTIYGLIQILGAKPLQTIIIVVGYLLMVGFAMGFGAVMANRQAAGPGFNAQGGNFDADFEAEMERLLQEAEADNGTENAN